jgi:hypothetical protein
MFSSLLKAEGFPCSLDPLYGGLGISKLPFLIKKRYKKTFNPPGSGLGPDPDPYPDSLEMLVRIRIRIQ